MSVAFKRFTLMHALLLLVLSPAAFALDAGGLIGMLTDQLGVTEQQASGGAGALLSSAKGNLSDADYAKLLKQAPDLANLSTESPATDKPASAGTTWGGLVSGAGALMGGKGKTLTQAATVAEQFDKLGLSPDMVAGYGKVMWEYVSGTGGTELADLFSNALPQ